MLRVLLGSRAAPERVRLHLHSQRQRRRGRGQQCQGFGVEPAKPAEVGREPWPRLTDAPQPRQHLLQAPLGGLGVVLRPRRNRRFCGLQGRLRRGRLCATVAHRLRPDLLQLFAEQLGLQRQGHKGACGPVGPEAGLRLAQRVTEAHGVAVERPSTGRRQPWEVRGGVLHHAQHVSLCNELEIHAGGALECLHGRTIAGAHVGVVVRGCSRGRPGRGFPVFQETGVGTQQQGLCLLPGGPQLRGAVERGPQQLIVSKHRETLRCHLEDVLESAARSTDWP
mmetsp:Transcript_4760/g.13114  ORF Transcript_4760/g.13114 Transcript_4760/m.13114 type:complete len:280 (+) Transcript_4760:301-1140(+)